MYPIPFYFLGDAVIALPGKAKNVYSFSAPAADSGSTGLTGDIPTTLLVTTTDGKLYGMGDNGYLLFGQSAPTTYGSWLTVLDSGVDQVLSASATGILIKMTDGSYRLLGTMPAGTRDAASVWTIAGIDLNNVREFALGEDHLLFLMNDNTLYGVGQNLYGALGSTGAKTTPTVITTGVTRVFSSGSWTAYHMKSTTLYASGYNLYGTLMNGNTSNRSNFQAVSLGGTVGVVQDFVASHLSVKVLTTSGEVWTAGAGGSGSSFGNQTSATKLTPGGTIPESPSGYQLLKRNSSRSSYVVRSGDGLSYFGNPQMGRSLGYPSELSGATSFNQVLLGLDHTLTTDACMYAGGTVLVNNGDLYQVGLDRPFTRPSGTPAQTIVYPIKKLSVPLP